MIPKDTLVHVQDTAVAAQSAKVVAIAGDHRRAIVTCGGVKEYIVIPAPLRDHASLDLDSLIQFIKRHDGMGEVHSSVWHHHEGVDVLIDDEDRRETLTFALETSKAFKAIREMEKGWQYTQAELVRLLRIDLHGCIPPELLMTLRSLNFTGSKAAQSTIQHDKSSLGRQVEAKVSGASALPDEFNIVCEIYANHDTGAQTFPIAIDVNFEEEKFRLTPLGECCHKNVQAAQNAIHDALIEGLGDSAMVYFGKP